MREICGQDVAKHYCNFQRIICCIEYKYFFREFSRCVGWITVPVEIDAMQNLNTKCCCLRLREYTQRNKVKECRKENQKDCTLIRPACSSPCKTHCTQFRALSVSKITAKCLAGFGFGKVSCKFEEGVDEILPVEVVIFVYAVR